MHPQEFNSLFLKSLTNKLSKESNKEIILLGDFNIDLIKQTQIIMHLNFLIEFTQVILFPTLPLPPD